MEQNKKSDNFEILAKAPGKIILSGEHAVVYGGKALACSISQFTYCKLSVNKSNSPPEFINISLVNLNKNLSIKKSLLFQHMKHISNLIIENNSFSPNESLGNIFSDYNFLLHELDIDVFKEIIIKNSPDLIERNEIHLLLMFNFLLFFTERLVKNDDLINITKSFINQNDITIKVESDIMLGAGLGSSASYNVSLCVILLQLMKNILLRNKIENEKFLNNLPNLAIIMSFLGEKVFHSRPSGIDNITSYYGGLIKFSSVQHFEQNFEILEKVEKYFKILLIDTKVRRNTSVFIGKVKTFKESFPDLFLKSIESIELVVKELYKILSTSNDDEEILTKVPQLIGINQNLLETIQVSCSEIRHLVLKLSDLNIFSKLTGAGGGGCVIAFIPRNREKEIVDFLTQHGHVLIDCKLQNNGCEVIEL
jgi:mevalonate kinase